MRDQKPLIQQQEEEIKALKHQLKVESLLDEIRTASIAMEKSTEFADIVLQIFSHLSGFDIEALGQTINIVNEEDNTHTQYLAFTDTTTGNNSIKAISDPSVKGTYLDWEGTEDIQKGEFLHRIKLEGSKLAVWIDHVEAYLDKDYGSALKKAAYPCVYAYMAMLPGQSNLVVTSLEPFTAQQELLLIKYANTLGLPYRRFLDLKKTEEQAHNAKLEAALERVRAASMTMQKSTELPTVAVSLLDQFEALALPSMGTGITIMNEEDWTFRCYFADNTSPQDRKLSITPTVSADSFWLSQESVKQYQQGIFEFTLEGDEDKIAKWIEWVRAYLSEERADRLKQLDLKKVYFHSICYHSVSNIVFSSISPLTSEHWSVIRRLAATFGQSYRRFLDLQKAEAQTREAQIEAALERVRSRTMGMQNSDELSETATVLFHQLFALGIKPGACAFSILNPEDRTGEVWITSDGKVNNRSYIHPYHTDPAQERIFEAWKAGKPYHLDDLENEELLNHLQFLAKHMPIFDMLDSGGNAASKRIVLHAIYFSQGFIGLTYESPQVDHLPTLMRFAKVFEQTYTRFLDLKKAEAQTREAQIDAALERIRARTMAMHNSDELTGVASLIFAELESLEIPPWTFGFNIWIDETPMTEAWSSSASSQIMWKMNVPHDVDPTLIAIYENRGREHVLFQSKIEGPALQRHIEYMMSLLDKDTVADLENSETKFPPEFNISAAYFKYGYLLIITDTPVDEGNSIFPKMAKVFEQTYTRFLDLQKAEAQTREAQIEAALERVRSRTMAMYTSDQLLDASTVLFHQLNQLGITLHTSGFSIMDEDKPTGKQYFSIGGDISPEPLPIIFDQDRHLLKAYNAWKNGEADLILDLQGSGLKEHLTNNLEQFQKLASIDFLTKASKRYEEPKGLSKNRMVVHHAFFKHGCLFITSDQPIRELEILKRFAKVFEQTYTRFLDLKKVEEQAREAQIEAALERVRAASMAMHNSQELKDVVTVTLEQLQGLNLPIDGCQMIIFSDSSKDLHFWSATPDMIYPVQLDIPYFNNPIFTNFWTAKENGASFTCFDVSLEDTLQFYNHVYQNTALGETVTTERWKKIQSIKYGFKTSWGIEKHTGLFIFNFSNQEFTPDENSVIKRFTRVFEQSYTRFLDLKKAEAQTREAQIEAALEKVRSTAMAMHSPDDLFEVVSELRKQMHNLGEDNLESSIIHIYHDNKEYYEAWWSFRPPGGTDNDIITGEVQIPFDNLWSQAVLKHYHSDQSSYMILSEGKMLHEWYRVLQVIAPETLDYDDNDEIMVPDRLYYYFSKFQGGALLMITEDEAKLEAIDLLNRASNVFGLAYQRFRDLKKAEAQAILNKKEASLDRIRGQIASMRSIDDLRHITPLIWNELTLLEIPFIRCGIFIMNQPREIIQMYFSTPSGQSLDVMEIPFDATQLVMQSVTHWQDKKIFVLQWSREQFVEWTRDLIDRGLVKDEQSYYRDQPPPDKMYLHFIPFKQGTIYVGSLDQLDDRQTGTIQSIADTFSVAYARYEDFKILENTLEELRTTQTQLIHSEKMASLGELTAGIAHEIQNPLNFVNNFSEVGSELIEEIEEEIENNDLETVKELLNELIENLKKIHHHGERASSIVRGMLDHSRTKSNEKTLSDINLMCDEYLRLAYHGLRAKNKSFQADFKLEVDPSLPKVSIASQDIGRVLLNLINNGFQAILEKSLKEDASYKPKLVVSTKKNQDSIEISITDNGPGIPDEIKDKIFQPFFTTKPTGEGTGLGLSLAYDIIKAHGGEIVVTSKFGEGTKFSFDLPVIEKS